MLLPLDIAVAIGARLRQAQGWTYDSLSTDMGTSASQVHRSVGRCRRAGLMVGEDRHVRIDPLLELLEHGVRWVYYAELGSLVRGVPTAHSSPVMQSLVAASGADAVVWPSDVGEVRGQALEPLYPGAAKTAEAWPQLCELLNLVDVLRVGRRREVSLAVELLRERMSL